MLRWLRIYIYEAFDANNCWEIFNYRKIFLKLIES